MAGAHLFLFKLAETKDDVQNLVVCEQHGLSVALRHVVTFDRVLNQSVNSQHEIERINRLRAHVSVSAPC